MNELQIFSNPEFGPVRALTISGEPWAVGKDVAAALGYSNTRDAVARHIDDEDKGASCFTTPSGEQTMTIINESGLYSLILSSKLPGAKRFKRWITSEVLPALRKTGRYELPQATPTQELPPPPGLTPTDYIRAANIIATCQKGRLPSVITLLERSGLDMSGVMEGATRRETQGEEADRIREFVGRQVPRDWFQWSIDRRRAFWAGEIPCTDTVPRDRISAIEVWCELFNRPPKELEGHSRPINAVLREIPGYRYRTIRAGAGYGMVKGFVYEGV